MRRLALVRPTPVVAIHLARRLLAKTAFETQIKRLSCTVRCVDHSGHRLIEQLRDTLTRPGNQASVGDAFARLLQPAGTGPTSLWRTDQIGHVVSEGVSKPDEKGAAAKIVVRPIAADNAPFVIVGRPAFLENFVREV